MSNFRRITPTASRDIENIMDYLAEKVSVEMAERFLEKINSKFQLLVKFPQIGSRRDELYPNLRSVTLEDYLIFYRLVPGGIEVMRVVGGYRDLEALFAENDED
ncbi:type II toxin-antitoxin system RelE/ParE family toxin [Aetokthonos hydrillicola Thurmond2011]|jgi:toxin ParE1/3/4|uniref:Type II toxin-antitoxin system RelE/ParE family toxin n=1 Tax=Aetokthonos hydrillicola Thurmond2011 TaxID=2712845 RepID=A0AAP5I958_9CYAN|nr:type II toxin-antitoxin system RelE/ParE family toxin [Aetokthonos hydrillicola]MBO3457569.1 type II toxin-antitoxin system RelE/ParE family toxin [Aetokthonos hydrillicola CCALA 1050]MBW4590903.1 type II toxin-antitoxin system RelE/ParE family toxin [Aetokthonos hydrillicola CCALA 1050]MDR9894750.1 type II toxin-antitoxin system RelE/ParE family toxin [Aetokthonos hydrillicola Thurmond2011]